jgi:hypothetical protein
MYPNKKRRGIQKRRRRLKKFDISIERREFNSREKRKVFMRWSLQLIFLIAIEAYALFERQARHWY